MWEKGLTAKLMCSFPFLNADDSFEDVFCGVENLFWKTKSFLEVQSIHQNHKKGLVVKPRR